MKKSLVALLVVATLIMSCASGVSAITKDEFFDVCKGLDREVVVPVDIMGKKTSDEDYGDSISARVNDGGSFKATIDMTNVKNVVNSVLDEAETALGTGSADLAAFKDLPVEGQFEITAKWSIPGSSSFPVIAPTNVLDRVPTGFTGLGDIFEIVEKRKNADNEVYAKIKVKDGIKVSNLAYLPDEISLEVGGFVLIADGQMDATISGNTRIKNGLTNYYDVTYKFVDGESQSINPVLIRVRTVGGGGGSATSTFVNITFDLGDGKVYKKVSVVEGRKFELKEVPEKEGYVFNGWYEDADLTKKITSVVADKDIRVYAGWTPVTDDPGTVEVAHPVPDALNGDDHFAYINGYPDGTVRPEANITRAEVATIFFRLLKEDVRAKNLTEVNVFEDVTDDDWFNAAVSTMAKMGIVNGRTATEFAPYEYITRAEFATICARFDDSDEKSKDSKFSDIAGHWAEDFILEAIAYRWINGYEDNTFRPDNNITRAEAATLINRVLVRIPEDATCLLDGMKKWPDNSASAWYYIAVQEATNSHTYGRINAVNEKWDELAENRDWTVYEK